MKTNGKLFLLLTVLSALIMNIVALPKAAAADPTAADWGGLLGKTAEQRGKLYQSFHFQPEYLYVGKVLSGKPYATVTYANPEDSRCAAKIRIWTGLVSRTGSDLYTSWDEIWTDRRGAVINTMPEMQEMIADYFAADSQQYFQSKAFLGVMPWTADLPTDAEAKRSKRSQIPADGIVNVYGMNVKELQLAAAKDQKSVALKAKIPFVVVDEELPADARRHWAKDYMIHLLRIKVVAGYKDHTIRPDKTLSRSEFVALLVRALGLNTAGNGDPGYADLKAHWSASAVAAAEEAGIVPKGSGAFHPDKPITRAEMAEFIYRAISRFSVALSEKTADFKDIGKLPADQRQALQYVIRTGIINGYPDGTFQPTHSLKRGEAFRVISALILLIHQV